MIGDELTAAFLLKNKYGVSNLFKAVLSYFRSVVYVRHTHLHHQ